MTKEEIVYRELGITGLSNAMDIYAKQEAISFADFIAKKLSLIYNTDSIIRWPFFKTKEEKFVYMTSEELFNEFEVNR